MKNIQIGDNDLLGSRFNGYDLHKQLIEKGVDSNLIVFDKKSKNKNTHNILNRFDKKLHKKLFGINKIISSHNLFYPYFYNLFFNKLFLEADIVHYQLIHNAFFNIAYMPLLTSLKPSVWTLHDPWAFTGHCIYPLKCSNWQNGCGNCPDLKSEKPVDFDSTALNWEMKKFYFSNSSAEIIVASKWMYDKVRISPIFSKSIIHYIPFGIDLNVFKPLDSSESRKKFNIPDDAIVISFRSNRSEIKGLKYIIDVLRKFETDKKICLLTFNEKGLLKEFKHNYKIIELGWVHDEKLLAEAYNASDFFLMPSQAESFGLMAIEAMACAKPVICFKETALEDTVNHPHGGIAVDYENSDMLYLALKRLIDNPDERMKIGKNALKYAQKNYDIKLHISKMIKLYKEVIIRHKKRKMNDNLLNELKKLSAREISI